MDVRLLAPRAELRLTVAGGSSMVDAGRLSYLGEALRAVLVLEVGGGQGSRCWRWGGQGSRGEGQQADQPQQAHPVLGGVDMHQPLRLASCDLQ
jgi:hypothetical protein